MVQHRRSPSLAGRALALGVLLPLLPLTACDGGAKAEAKARAEAAKAIADAEAGKAKAEAEAAAAKAALAEAAAAKPEEAAPAPKIGHVDPAFLRSALELAGLERLKIGVRVDGSVDEIEAYHQDAAKVPAPVLERLKEVYPGAKILAYELELEQDETGAPATIHEIEVRTKDKKACELEARADGTVVKTECTQASKSASAEIRELVEKMLPGAKIVEIELSEPPTGGRETEVLVEWKGQRHVFEFEGADDRMTRHAREVPATVVIEIP